MQIFVFGSHDGGRSWGEVEEVAIIAADEAQAWQILEEYRKIIFRREDWTLEEIKPLAVGVAFSTSYTLGV
jgi:hypothetical protein